MPASTIDAITVIVVDDLGQVTNITGPDGSFVEMTYDGAHRLERIEDALGNTIEYSLDAAGNRFADETRDGNGTLRHTLTRLFDGLGQLESIANAASDPTDFSYDAAGNLDTTTDALGRIHDNAYDALGRLRESIANTAGSGAQRPVTQIGYDALDRTTSVVDPKGLTTSYVYDGFGSLAQLISPDTGTTTYGYDAAGRRTSSTDARGVQSTYAYDGLGRITGIDRPSAGQDVAFTLDTVPSDCLTGETFGVGRLGTMTDPSGSTKYCYDRRGNVVRKVQAVTIASTTRTVGYAYNHADAVVGMTYPSGATVAYARDGNGRIVGVTVQPSAGATAATVISDVDYLPFGPMSVLAFGNGRTLTRSYDLDYGIDAVTDSNTSGLSINLGLDVVGNVTSLAERKADGTTASRSVGYDAVDRLTSFNDSGTVVQGFTYDATGNRMSKTSGGSTAAYTYPSTSHLLTNGTGARTYDAAGNSTNVAGRVYVYDDAGRRIRHILNGSTVREFAYNGRGERVARIITTSPANDQIMVYDEAGHLIGEYLKNGTRLREIVWMDETPVAVLATVGSSTYQYILTDHLNTPRQIVVPATNVTVWRWDIATTAFGDHAANQDPDGDGTNYAFFLRYPGQYYDEDSGVYYNYFRDYDSTAGRYLQSDPIGLNGGISSYSYADGSPLSKIDPRGLSSFALIPGATSADSACIQDPALCADIWGHYSEGRAALAERSCDNASAEFWRGSAEAADGVGGTAILAVLAVRSGRGLPARGRSAVPRVRHHTSPEALRRIQREGQINPARGGGVHVETQAFGPARGASRETGAFGRGAYVEFDAPASIVRTVVGPRNTGLIPTGGPLSIGGSNPTFVTTSWWKVWVN